MTEQEIIQGNRIIAEWMGARKFQDTDEYHLYGLIYSIEDEDNESHYFNPKDMKFLTDWNWLMQVVENIEGCGVTFKLKSDYNIFHNINIHQATFEKENLVLSKDGQTASTPSGESEFTYRKYSNGNRCKIMAVYEACLDFIKWHNQLKK